MARSFARTRPTKQARDAFYIHVEGQTEKAYLEGFRKRARIPKGLVTVEVAHGTSIGNIKHELDRIRQGKARGIQQAEFDQFWGVADTEWDDSWKALVARPDSGATASSAKPGRRILWALSSSSFERWLLLHFEPNPPTLNARASADRVGNYLSGYSHASKRLSDQQLDALFGKTEAALANAEHWRNTSESESNFTDVDLLIRELCGHK